MLPAQFHSKLLLQRLAHHASVERMKMAPILAQKHPRGGWVRFSARWPAAPEQNRRAGGSFLIGNEMHSHEKSSSCKQSTYKILIGNEFHSSRSAKTALCEPSGDVSSFSTGRLRARSLRLGIVRARLQPCRSTGDADAALAAEGRDLSSCGLSSGDGQVEIE
jgi:hypothetical protein